MSDPVFDAIELARLSAEFEARSASEVVAWAVDTFGDDLLLAASFQDAVLIDISTRIKPDIEVLFIDTLDLFPETYETVERIRKHYDLNLTWSRVPEPLVPFHVADPVHCCSAAKVAALERGLRGKRAWLSGIRRADSVDRAGTPVVALDRRGLVKINPIAMWSDADVKTYVAANDVPYNPLLDLGYPSIGCMPTTQPVPDGGHPRAGRWAGADKKECGLHD